MLRTLAFFIALLASVPAMAQSRQMTWCDYWLAENYLKPPYIFKNGTLSWENGRVTMEAETINNRGIEGRAVMVFDEEASKMFEKSGDRDVSNQKP